MSSEAGRRLAELRRSGNHGPMGDRRTKRNRDRSSQERNAIKDQND